jgi:hypothetical protein
MKAIFGIALVAAMILAGGCNKKQAAPPAAPATNTSTADATSAETTNAAPAAKPEKKAESGNPITAPVDYLGAVAQAQQTAIKKIDLSYITHAIQQFNAEEGRNPKDLDELVSTHYLNKIPAAPFGKKLQYDATTGAVTVVNK